jgi:dihydroxyacetone kinase-like protein
MLDAACPGEIFVAPSPEQVLAAAEAVHAGRGVLFVVKNFSGDVSSFHTAANMFGFENAMVLVDDDVAVESSPHSTGRRGIAGTLIVEKVVGSLAETGADLAACKALGDRVNRRTASMGVALSSCTEPSAGRPTFEIGEREIEMGVGIHGEPGRRREPWKPADAIAAELVDAIVADLKPACGSEALLLVNGLGGTPLMELYLLFGTAQRQLAKAGVTVVRALVGNYSTSLEMAGASLTVCLLDDEIRHHWDSPVHTPMLRWGR